MKIFGFTLLRNGIKYDFPFQESLRSLAPAVEKIYIALATSDDGTEAAVEKLPKLEIISTEWSDTKKGEGGLILSEQTNIALDEIRKHHRSQDTWAIYLQADEVLLENEYENLKRDIIAADKNGCDAISMRYIHFWQRPDQFAFRKRWYPQEIRVVRVNTKIESWGDAQSFRNCEKIFESNVPVYHYGHVREPDAYKKKMLDVMDWWHKADEIPRLRKRNKRRELREKTLPYLGPHPAIMHKRVNNFFQMYGHSVKVFERKNTEVFITGDTEGLSERFISGICANSIQVAPSILGVPPHKWNQTVSADGGILNRLLAKNSVPQKMQSERALPWTKEFYVATQLWSKGIGTEFVS